jgi:hypothetical protein
MRLGKFPIFLERISDELRRLTNGWVALGVVILFILFMALVLPGQAARSEAQTGGVGSPDTSFFYSAQDLYAFAEAYGEQGRQAYVRARWTFDLVFPLVYGFTLAITISWINRWAFPKDTGWQKANLLPLLGVVFDFLENASTSIVMLRYPARIDVVAWLAPVFTLLKWTFITGSFGVLLAGLGYKLAKRLHNQ